MATSTKKDTTVKATTTVGKTATATPKSVGSATSSGVSAAKATAITPTSSAAKTSGYVSDKNNIVSAANISAENQATLQQILADNGMSFNGSYNDAFYGLKENSGFAGKNDYNTTIGNATLNQYGYGVNEYGRIYKLEEPKEEQSGDGRPIRAADNVNAADLYNHYQGVRSDMNNATQELVNSINANKPQIEQTYQDQQKQAYINKVLQDSQMNDYLKAQGLSGGMAESTALAAANAYDAQRQAAYQTKQQALTEIEKMVAEAKATGNTNLANAAMQYMSQYQDAMKHLDNLNYQYYSTDLNQFNIDREFAANQAQQQYQNAWNERVYGDQMAQQSYQNQWNEKVYGDTMSQQSWQNQFTQQQYADQMAQQAYQNAWNEKIYGDSQTQQQWENDFALKQLGLKSSGSSTSSKTPSTNPTPNPDATPSKITSYDQLSQKAKDTVTGLGNWLRQTSVTGNTKAKQVATKLAELKEAEEITPPEVEFILSYFGY